MRGAVNAPGEVQRLVAVEHAQSNSTCASAKAAGVLRGLETLEDEEQFLEWLAAQPRGKPHDASAPRPGAPPAAAGSRPGRGAQAPPPPPSLDLPTLNALPPALRGLISPGHSSITGRRNVRLRQFKDGAWSGLIYEGRDPPKPGAKRAASVKEDSARFVESLARSRAKLRYLCRCLGADRILTLTKRGKFSSLDELWRVLDEFCRLLAVRYPARKFEYVAVPELHQDGASWHIHLAVSGFWDVNVLRLLWHRALGAPHLLRGSESPGNIDITPQFSGRGWRGASKYLSKYLGKGFGSIACGRRLFSSTKGLSALKEVRFHFLFDVTADEVRETVFLILEALSGRTAFEWWKPPDSLARCWFVEEAA